MGRKDYTCTTCQGEKYIKCNRGNHHSTHWFPSCCYTDKMYEVTKSSCGGHVLKCPKCDGMRSASFRVLRDTCAVLTEAIKLGGARQNAGCECDGGWVMFPRSYFTKCMTDHIKERRIKVSHRQAFVAHCLAELKDGYKESR